MTFRKRFYGLSWLLLLGLLVLAACGDATNTSAPAAAPTTAPTTAAATTAASTTAAATTAAAASGATTAAAGAATTVAATPTAPLPTRADASAEAGRQVVARNCAGCHLQQGLAAGRAPQLSTSQNAINADFVRNQVRNGSASKRMPAFDQTKISDADLANIILYLKAIHKT